MKEYIIDNIYLYDCSTVTDGTQLKYLKEGYFYKINKLGNEGFVEYLVSGLLGCSSLPRSLWVSYEYCIINGYLGCKSRSFLKENESFISMASLYKRIYGSNLADKLSYLNSANARLQFLKSCATGIGVSSFQKYLGVLVQLDMLIGNIDRHIYNYGFVYNSSLGLYRSAPIFDNGLALGTSRRSFISSTLSGSFEDQVLAFGYPIKPLFVIGKSKYEKFIASVRGEYGNSQELDMLEERVDKYATLFLR